MEALPFYFFILWQKLPSRVTTSLYRYRFPYIDSLMFDLLTSLVGKLPVDDTKEILTKKKKILAYFISELVRNPFEVPV